VLVVDITSAEPKECQELINAFKKQSTMEKGPKMLLLFGSNNKLGLGQDLVSFGELRVFRQENEGKQFLPQFEKKLQKLYDTKYKTHTIDSWVELLGELSSRRRLVPHLSSSKLGQQKPSLPPIAEEEPEEAGVEVILEEQIPAANNEDNMLVASLAGTTQSQKETSLNAPDYV